MYFSFRNFMEIYGRQKYEQRRALIIIYSLKTKS